MKASGRLTIEKGGLIERTGDGGLSHGVLRFDHESLTAVNRGTIRSTGNDVSAVVMAGANTRDATFENWGTVETQGDSSVGISSSWATAGERNTVINRGLITTRGQLSGGISIGTPDARITNFGRILVSGNGASGITSVGNNVRIVTEAGSLIRVTGTEHTSGSNTRAPSGIWASDGSNAKVDIKAGALVEVTGDSSQAVRLGNPRQGSARVDAATLTVGGTVRAIGANSYGIRTFDDDATIHINKGALVETTGSNSHALFFGFDGQTAIGGRFPTFTVGIGGTVRATGANSYAITGHNSVEKITLQPTAVIRGAINLGGNPDTLVIHSGARIYGRIHLGSGTDVLRFVYTGTDKDGKKIEKTVGFGRGTVRHLLGEAKDADGKRRMSRTFKYTVYGVAGATGDTLPAVINYHEVDATMGPAMLRAMAGDAAHAVQGAMVSEVLSGTAGRNGWVSVSGDSRRQKGEEFDHKRRNLHLVGGVEMMAAENWQVGFAAGAWNGKASADTASIEAKGSGAGAGFYTGYSFGDFTVSGSLLAGRNKYEVRRGVLQVDNEKPGEEGTKTAVGSGKGKWIGASIGAATDRYALDFLEGGWSLRPQVVASWVRLEQDEHEETGLGEGADLEPKARKDRILVLDGEVGIARPFAEGTGEVELLTGITYQRRTGDKATVQIGTQNVSQAIDQGRSVTDLRLGVDVHYALSASSELDFGVDYSRGKDKASGYSASFAYRIGF